MEKKYSLTLDKDFVQFCQLNDILEVEKFAGELLYKAFTEYKFGRTPRSTPPAATWKTCGAYPLCLHVKCECREDQMVPKTIKRVVERKEQPPPTTTPITTKPIEDDLYGE